MRLTLHHRIKLILSFVTLALLFAWVSGVWPAHQRHLLRNLDNVIALYFFCDFIYQWETQDRKDYMSRWGWFDLVTSLPWPFIYLGEWFRVIHGLRCAKSLVHTAWLHNRKRVFPLTILAAVLLVCISSVSILLVETGPTANIKTVEDAVWWSVVSVSTTGYGDKYPVTSSGRLMAIILILLGMGVFALLTGQIAAKVLKASENEEKP